jgi:hypothetical protein
MTYVIPDASGTNDQTAIDGKGVAFGAAVQASAAGFGVTGTDGTNTHEILDAMPMNRAATQNSIEAASTVDFSTQDLLTGSEISALADTAQHAATSDLT